MLCAAYEFRELFLLSYKRLREKNELPEENTTKEIIDRTQDCDLTKEIPEISFKGSDAKPDKSLKDCNYISPIKDLEEPIKDKNIEDIGNIEDQIGHITDIPKEEELQIERKGRKFQYTRVDQTPYTRPTKSTYSVCEYCGKAFSTHALKEHQLRMHKGQTSSFFCNECGVSKQTKGELKRHMETHGNEAYKCRYCPKVYKSRSTCSSHMKTHEVDSASLRCCGKIFTQMFRYNRHLKTHRGREVLTCHVCNEKFIFQTTFEKHFKSRHVHNEKEIGSDTPELEEWLENVDE